MKKRGFTLIELLVVIAIIGLLLAVIVPSLKKAKRYAKKVIDHTNLRSLSNALQIYLNNSNDKFFGYGTGTLWMDRIGDIVDNMDDIRFCPETVAKKSEVVTDWTATPASKWGSSLKPWLWNNSADPTERYEMGSYALNGWFYADTGFVQAPDKPFIFGNRANVRSPSTTPFILDSYWVDGWPKNTNTLPNGYDYTGDTTDHGGTNSSSTTMMGRFLLDRHGPETNVILLDGQVVTIPHADLWTLTWHRESKPNYDVRPPQPVPAKK